MYLTNCHFTFKADQIDRAKELMKAIVIIGRQDKGILSYTFYANPDKENSYFLLSSEEMGKIVPKFFELLAEQPSVTYFDATIESTL